MTDSISESPRERQGARVGRHEAQAAVAGARLGGRELAHPADHAMRAILQLRVAVSAVSIFSIFHIQYVQYWVRLSKTNRNQTHQEVKSSISSS